MYIAGGATPKIENEENFYSNKENGVLFLRVQNVLPQGLRLDDSKYISVETHNGFLKRSQFKEGDVVTKITGVGRMAISTVIPKGIKGNINQHLVVIRTKNLETSEIISAFLNTDIGERLATRRSTGGTRPALDYEALQSIPIIYDPKILNIQKEAYSKRSKIDREAYSLLHDIDAFVLKELGVSSFTTGKKIYSINLKDIENRLDPLYYTQNLLRSLKKSPYSVVPIGEVCKEFKSGFAAGKQDQSENDLGLIQLRPTNINNHGDLYFDKIVLLEKENQISRKADILKKEEVLFNNTNSQDWVGKSAYFNLDGIYFCSNHITRITVDKNRILPEYLWIMLNVYQKMKIFYNVCTNWNNQSGVNTELLKTIKIPVPDDLSVQRKIVDEVNSRKFKSNLLKKQAFQIFENAKKEVEKILLD